MAEGTKRLKSEPGCAEQKGFLAEFYSSPTVLFLLAIGIVFVAEFLVMLLLNRLPKLEPVTEALIDSTLLASLIVPALYLFVYLPLKGNINRRRRSEAQHQRMHEIDLVKSQFISTAAHEFSTPLTSIMGYSELLLSSADLEDAERRDYLQTIHQKALVLDRLVNDLLDLSRIDSGQVVRLEKTRQDLLPIVDSVVHYFQYTEPDRTIEMIVPDELPMLVIDAVRVGQVLENLISNAIKYSPDGGTVKIEVERDSHDVKLSVSDQGVGMSDDQQEQIFEKFYRADRSDTATDGLGLGMTIVKEIVIGHGGSVTVDSEIGRGTTVQVVLPCN